MCANHVIVVKKINLVPHSNFKDTQNAAFDVISVALNLPKMALKQCLNRIAKDTCISLSQIRQQILRQIKFV